MAKAEIKCTCPECGATHYWSTTCYNRREADRWEEYHADEANTRLCPECYRKHRAAERAEAREAANKAAAENVAALGLPALTGTEKQVAWATTIRQRALDEALSAAAGGSTRDLNDEGRALVSAVLGRMSAEARWWIDHRDDAADLVREELECANWARLDDATRAAHMDKLRADAERFKGAPAAAATKATLAQHERYERARLAGRSSMEQREVDKAEAAAKKAAEEAAQLAALPPKPATLAERVGKPGSRWNQKFYGRDGLRVYLAGDNTTPIEVQDVQSIEFGGKTFGDMLDASGRLYTRTKITDFWGGIDCYEYDSPRLGHTWAYEMICQYAGDGFAQVLINVSAPIHSLDLGPVDLRGLLKRVENDWVKARLAR